MNIPMPPASCFFFGSTRNGDGQIWNKMKIVLHLGFCPLTASFSILQTFSCFLCSQEKHVEFLRKVDDNNKKEKKKEGKMGIKMYRIIFCCQWPVFYLFLIHWKFILKLTLYYFLFPLSLFSCLSSFMPHTKA